MKDFVKEACQGPVFHREGIWTEITSCWSQLWQHGLRSKKDPHRWLITHKLNFIQRQRAVRADSLVLTLCSPNEMALHAELFFFGHKTQFSTWLNTLPNGTYKTFCSLKINPGHSEAKGLFRVTITICIWNYNFQFQKGIIQYRYGLIFIQNIRQKSFHSERRHSREIQARLLRESNKTTLPLSHESCLNT